jgi:hypothetical protein
MSASHGPPLAHMPLLASPSDMNCIHGTSQQIICWECVRMRRQECREDRQFAILNRLAAAVTALAEAVERADR